MLTQAATRSAFQERAYRSTFKPLVSTPASPRRPSAAPGGEDDARLVARVLEGETGAYAGLVQRYQAGLYHRAFAMVRDADLAADLVQDAFVKAYTRLESCNDPARFGAWIHRILVNRCKDHLKSPRHARTVPLEEAERVPSTGDRTDAAADRVALREGVERALAALPEVQREAFLLKHVEELSYEEMSGLLGVSAGALRMRVLRAREGLREMLRSRVAE